MNKFFWTLLILIASVLFLISALTKNMLVAISALALSLILEMTRRTKDPKKDKSQPKEFLEDIKRSGKIKNE